MHEIILFAHRSIVLYKSIISQVNEFRKFDLILKPHYDPFISKDKSSSLLSN